MRLFKTTAAIVLLTALSSASGAAENDIIKIDVRKSGWEYLNCIYVTVTASRAYSDKKYRCKPGQMPGAEKRPH